MIKAIAAFAPIHVTAPCPNNVRPLLIGKSIFAITNALVSYTLQKYRRYFLFWKFYFFIASKPIFE
jgi:hypothetical protein